MEPAVSDGRNCSVVDFSKLGVPIKTTISAGVLKDALSGTVTIRPLPLSRPMTEKVGLFLTGMFIAGVIFRMFVWGSTSSEFWAVVELMSISMLPIYFAWEDRGTWTLTWMVTYFCHRCTYAGLTSFFCWFWILLSVDGTQQTYRRLGHWNADRVVRQDKVKTSGAYMHICSQVCTTWVVHCGDDDMTLEGSWRRI